MPFSSSDGKAWSVQRMKHMANKFQIKQIVDVGAGAGTYTEYRNLFPHSVWTGLEAWEPYVEQYQLKDKYDQLIMGDVRLQDWTQLPSDLVIMGDVLEHMTKEQAVALVNQSLASGKLALVSLPVVYYPQDAWEGNEYERHVKPDWSYVEFTETFGDLIIDGQQDGEIGVFVLTSKPEVREQYNKLKIAIYTICKDEADSVERWANSNAEADIRLVCDTGSTDDTVARLQAHGVQVFNINIKPWRFDTARNASLNLLPPDVDVCIWQDLDEALLPGWRQAIEANWTPGTTIANHRYRNNGSAWQWHYKIHARRLCRWRFPVHEKLLWAEGVEQHHIWLHDFYLDEQQAHKESRAGYIDLLEQKIQEGDTDWKTLAFMAGEYAGRGDIDREIQCRHRCYDMCEDGGMILSYCARLLAGAYHRKGDHTNADLWFFKAVQDSAERETLYHWALSLQTRRDWDNCYVTMKKCLTVTHRSDGFTQDPAAWGWPAYDLAALAAYNVGLYAQAAEYGREALSHAPDDQRLQMNQNFYEDKLNG